MEKIHPTLYTQTSHIYGSFNRQNKGKTTESILIMRSIHNGCKIGENSNSHNFSFSKEYERLTENERIAKRISNPKRDRWIQESFKRSIIASKSFSSEEKAKNKKRKKFSNTISEGWKIERIPSVRESQEDYELKIQNERMGKRIMNMKPKIISFHSRNESRANLQNSKINEGVKAFFNINSFLNQNFKENLLNSQLKSYGFGSTLISLRHIKIETHPALKQEDYLYFELLVKNTNPKLYTTSLMNYKTVLEKNLKFSVRINKLGDSVPLRIWKSQGLDNVELGIIDIFVSQKVDEKDKMIDGSFERMENFEEKRIIQKNNDERQSKLLMRNEISKKMRKTKTEECQNRISFEYEIYKKKYS